MYIIMGTYKGETAKVNQAKTLAGAEKIVAAYQITFVKNWKFRIVKTEK